MILTPELEPDSYEFIVELAKNNPRKPVYVSFSGDTACDAAAKAYLEPRGVPTFPSIEDPFKALDILVRSRRALKR
jgi:acyl-CoA synthetase (NDP forming)